MIKVFLMVCLAVLGGVFALNSYVNAQDSWYSVTQEPDQATGLGGYTILFANNTNDSVIIMGDGKTILPLVAVPITNFSCSDCDPRFINKDGDTGTWINLSGDLATDNIYMGIDPIIYAIPYFTTVAGRLGFDAKGTVFNEYGFYANAVKYFQYSISPSLAGFQTNVVPMGFLSADYISLTSAIGTPIDLRAGDTSDYIRITTTTNVPKIGTVGNTDLNIDSDGGTTSILDDVYISGIVGIGNTTPLHPLTVYGGTGGIGVFVEQNVSADDYITRTTSFNPTKNPKDYIKNYDYYLNPDGSVDHSKYYGHVTFEIPDLSRPVKSCKDVTVEICDYTAGINFGVCENVTEIECEDVYPFMVEEDGISLGMEIDLLRQELYNKETEIQMLEFRIRALEMGISGIGL